MSGFIQIEHEPCLSLLRICSVMSAIVSSFKCSEYKDALLCPDAIDNIKRLESEYGNWNFVLVLTCLKEVYSGAPG